MPVGCHCSISGGHDKALRLGKKLGCECVQVFTKNNMRWFAKPLQEEAVAAYQTAREETGITNVFGHAGYLINLAAKNPANLRKSRQSLLDELERCAQLKLPFLVLHPGAHLGQGEEAGLKKILESLDWVFRRYDGPAKIALETTSGQGSVLGCKLAHLERLLKTSVHGARLAVCLDTCHLFSAGYDLRAPAAIEQFVKNFKKHLPWKKIAAVHLNDSKRELGSRKDRHELLGKGEIGWTCFKTMLRHPAFSRLPLCLETPKDKKHENDRAQILKLKTLRDKTARIQPLRQKR